MPAPVHCGHPSGALIREYVWNGWEPVAVIEGGVVSFVRADHIGRPVFATNSTGVKVWSTTYHPFGGVHVSTGTLPPNRFPGQWFQSESGLHQNWMRDYDPTTGRYLQADPLGLVDGASVYGYVRQTPMRFMDPTGEFIPQLVFGFALGAALEWVLNPCATFSDIVFAGAFGALAGGLSKVALLRYGPRSLTRETGLEWSHSLSREWIKNNVKSTWLKRYLNRRGGANGSWTPPARHYKHDPNRYPSGWQNFGNRSNPYGRFLDRIPDWMKATALSITITETLTQCECE